MHVATTVPHITNKATGIYPNPNNGEFILQGYNDATLVTIEVLNLYGQVVSHQGGYVTSAEKISATHLPTGQYLLRVKTTGEVQTFLFSIKR